MNSPPMNGTSSSVAAKINVATIMVVFGWSRHHVSSPMYFSFTHSNGLFRTSRTPFLNQYEHITGTNVSVRIKAPIRAMDIVSAIG